MDNPFGVTFPNVLLLYILYGVVLQCLSSIFISSRLELTGFSYIIGERRYIGEAKVVILIKETPREEAMKDNLN